MIEILEPGPLSSVQDAEGRLDWRHLGVPVGGAADAWSARLANRLVGNADGDALLEITLGGASLRLATAAVVALTGGLSATAGGMPLPADEGRRLAAGTVVRIGPGVGARGYLAVAGGVQVEPILGSRSTDLRAGFGGLEGRALRPGDRLEVGEGHGPARRWMGTRPAGPVRITRGPHDEAFDRLLEIEWTVGVEADRAGVRLDGGIGGSGEVASMGVPLGAIQLPPDGRPIVMLADRPVTGGYPVPACVIGADVERVAQLRTGDRVTFASVSLDEARAAQRRAEGELAALETIETPADDELGWAGSHD